MIEALKHKSYAVMSLIVILLLLVFAFINFPFLVPFVLAGIFALGLNDFVNKGSVKLRISRKPVVLLVVFAGLCFFWVPLSLAAYRIGLLIAGQKKLEADSVMAQFQTIKEFALNLVDKISDVTGADLTSPARDTLETVVRKAGEILWSYSTQFLGQLPAIIFASFVFLIFVLTLLWKAPQIKQFSIRYSFVDEALTEKLITIFKRSCAVTLFSTFVIGLIQACIIGLGSLIFGIGDFWLVVTVTFVVSFIPFIGAGPVGFLLTLIAFLQGHTGAGIGMLLVSLTASTIDNVLKPLLAGGDSNIPAIVGFTCVVGAIIMLGLPGLLLGPVIMNLFVRIMPILLPMLKREPNN